MHQPQAYRQIRFRRPPGATELVLIRHGESAPFSPDAPFPLRDGHGDPPLAAVGHRQAEAVGRHLASEPIEAIYVTTLQRTHQTAAPLAATLGLEPAVIPELREVHLGEWEGGALRQRATVGDPIFEQMMREQRWDVIPGAEPHAAFLQRVRTGIEEIHRRHPDQVVAVVAHGGVIGLILAEAVRASGFAFSADNASISRLVVHGERWTLRGFNDVRHLVDVEDDPDDHADATSMGSAPGS